MAASDARPVPRKNVAYRVTFPIFNISGDPVPSGLGLDSEISKDQGVMTDCSGEAIYITGSAGMYYLDITATEMNADTVALEIKSTGLNAKTTSLVLYPEESGDYRVNVVQITGIAVSTAIPMIGVNTINNLDKTGYTVSTVQDKAGYTISGTIKSLDPVNTNLTVVSGNINTVSTNVTTLLNTSVPYYAKIDLTIDTSNIRDEYTVLWYSGTTVLTTGVTSPTIEVIKRDGTTLIPSTGMTGIGSTHVFGYNESVSARRVTAGDAVITTVQGSIGGSTRTWRNLLARDS